MWTYNYTSSNALQHWGIPGMKWGVRRYQNKDGTLTRKGMARLAKADFDGDKVSDAVLTKYKIKNGQNTKDKDTDDVREKVKKMSDEDLKKLLNRLQMEKQVAQLLSEPEAKKVEKGKGIAKKMLAAAGTMLATKAAAKLGDYLGERMVNKKRSKDDASNKRVADNKAARELRRTSRRSKKESDRNSKRADQLFDYYNQKPRTGREQFPRAGRTKYLDRAEEWLI